jgi:hypothetical protein
VEGEWAFFNFKGIINAAICHKGIRECMENYLIKTVKLRKFCVGIRVCHHFECGIFNTEICLSYLHLPLLN